MDFSRWNLVDDKSDSEDEDAYNARNDAHLKELDREADQAARYKKLRDKVGRDAARQGAKTSAQFAHREADPRGFELWREKHIDDIETNKRLQEASRRALEKRKHVARGYRGYAHYWRKNRHIYNEYRIAAEKAYEPEYRQNEVIRQAKEDFLYPQAARDRKKAEEAVLMDAVVNFEPFDPKDKREWTPMDHQWEEHRRNKIRDRPAAMKDRARRIRVALAEKKRQDAHRSETNRLAALAIQRQRGGVNPYLRADTPQRLRGGAQRWPQASVGRTIWNDPTPRHQTQRAFQAPTGAWKSAGSRNRFDTFKWYDKAYKRNAGHTLVADHRRYSLRNKRQMAYQNLQRKKKFFQPPIYRFTHQGKRFGVRDHRILLERAHANPSWRWSHDKPKRARKNNRRV